MARTATVWLVNGNGLTDEALAAFIPWLSPGEAARYQRFVRRQRQRQFLIGRILLRMAIGKLRGVAADSVILAEQPGRAPRLILPDPALGVPGFSLSHSGDWVACAVSADTALGLDVEVIDPARDILAIGAQAFDAAEAAWLSGLPVEARIAAFYQLWSGKEARHKLGACAAPSCISLPHDSLSVVLCSAQPLAAAPPIVLTTLAFV